MNKTNENILSSVVTGELDGLICHIGDIVEDDKNLIEYVEKVMSSIFLRKNKKKSFPKNWKHCRFFVHTNGVFSDGTLFLRIIPSGRIGYCRGKEGKESKFVCAGNPLQSCLKYAELGLWKEISPVEAFEMAKENKAL